MINRILERAVIGQPEAKVGMGATILMWSDRYAATIVKVEKDGNMIAVQDDESKIVSGNGMDGSARYEFSRNPNGGITWFKKDPDGRWRQMYTDPITGKLKVTKKGSGNGLRIGSRDEYRDPSF